MDEHLAALLKQLEEASETYRGAGRQREGAAAALEAVLNYLRAVDPPEESYGHLRAPLLDLLGALSDAERGISNPLTAPEEHPGGRPKPLKGGHNDAAKAAGVELLMRRGMKLEEALAKFSKAPDERKAIRECRKNIRRGAAPAEAISFYEFILKAAGKHELPPKNAADAILQFVRNMAGKKA